MTMETGRMTRVIGWYHSHPHITVLPSHVDVRTRAMYQLLDAGFVGLIFSCFNEDQYKVGRIQVTAFQSLDGKQNNVLRPVPVSPINKSSIIDLESSLSTENSLSSSGSARVESLEHDTGDSRAVAGASKGTKEACDNVIVGSKDGKLCLFDMDLSSKPYKILKSYPKDITNVAFHRNYPLFASAASDDCKAYVFHDMVYSDLNQNPLIVPLEILHGHKSVNGRGVLDCKFHPRQPWLFTAEADSVIKLFCH